MVAGKLTYQQREQRKVRRQAFLTVGGVVVVSLLAINALSRRQPSSGASAPTVASASADHGTAPNENTFDGKLAADHNRELYGHAWDQTESEKAADSKWQDVKEAEGELPGIGGDYKAYNATLTSAYRRWEAAERAAYGSNWQALWKVRNTGDILGECGSMQGLGMTRSECIATEQAKGTVEPLEPMLMKCSPGGDVMPRDAISCRTHGRQSEYSVRRDALKAGEAVSEDTGSN